MTLAKNVSFKLSGDEFFMLSIVKVMVPLQSPGFLLYVFKFAIVFSDIRETFTTVMKLLTFFFQNKVRERPYANLSRYKLHNVLHRYIVLNSKLPQEIEQNSFR